ncbi:MAG: repressor LexA [Firmicutes bacterium HGW-Firmicutes-9]|jgi:repressor LexA|nr:MAG: repressor LexA [Firmicutes bacterium HGW-Firmicutes-9]
MKKLADPQQVILDYMISFTEEHAYPPSVREICAAVGLKSTATVHTHLRNLEKRGLITRDPSKQRAVFINTDLLPEREEKQFAIPLVGRVAAGLPMLAAENIEDAFPLPDVLMHGKEPTEVYMLRVDGESMRDAGIRDGDILVVNHNCNCVNGDIVVARVHGESATVKRFFREKDRVRLQPENDLFDPIYVPFDEVEISGKVIGLLRSI